MVCSPPGSSVPGLLQARVWSVLPFPFLGDLPDPGIKLTSPTMAGGFFTGEAPELLWAKVTGLLSVYSAEAEMETTASSLPLLGSPAKWQFTPHHTPPVVPHQASSGQHFSIGTTEQAIFIYSVWIKYKEHCAIPLK